ncbi:hypothetical protein TNCV_271731 [Trichonephila clavipes]|nr:hypothetical protein TNCV_271731 [Trichonephila clavipes]
MDIYKCIVHVRTAVPLNSRQATSPLVRLLEMDESGKTPDHLQDFLSQNYGETEPNRTVTYLVIKVTDDDRHVYSPLPR